MKGTDSGSRAARTDQPRILYVEDNVINAKVVCYGLRGHYQVTVASSDRQACNEIRDHSSDYAAILMDIELQGSALDGIELTRLFRGALSNETLPDYAQGLSAVELPIIIVTAFAERYASNMLIEAGADSYLNKPVDFSILLEILSQRVLH